MYILLSTDPDQISYYRNAARNDPKNTSNPKFMILKQSDSFDQIPNNTTRITFCGHGSQTVYGDGVGYTPQELYTKLSTQISDAPSLQSIDFIGCDISLRPAYGRPSYVERFTDLLADGNNLDHVEVRTFVDKNPGNSKGGLSTMRNDSHDRMYVEAYPIQGDREYHFLRTRRDQQTDELARLKQAFETAPLSEGPQYARAINACKEEIQKCTDKIALLGRKFPPTRTFLGFKDAIRLNLDRNPAYRVVPHEVKNMRANLQQQITDAQKKVDFPVVGATLQERQAEQQELTRLQGEMERYNGDNLPPVTRQTVGLDSHNDHHEDTTELTQDTVKDPVKDSAKDPVVEKTSNSEPERDFQSQYTSRLSAIQAKMRTSEEETQDIQETPTPKQ